MKFLSILLFLCSVTPTFAQQSGGAFSYLAEPKVGYESGDLESNNASVEAGGINGILIEGLFGVRWQMLTGGLGMNLLFAKIATETTKQKYEANRVDKFLHIGFIPLPFARISFDWIFKTDSSLIPDGQPERHLDGSGYRIGFSAGVAPSTLLTVAFTTVNWDTLSIEDSESEIDGVKTSAISLNVSWPLQL